MFGTRFTQALGIQTPSCCVPAADERVRICRHLSPRDVFEDPAAHAALWTCFNKGGKEWLLSEFCPGGKLHSLGHRDGVGQGDVAKVLFQCGQVAAVDAVLNNYDRLPLVHPNSGNPDNWVVADDFGVWAIDQSVSPIKVAAGQDVRCWPCWPCRPPPAPCPAPCSTPRRIVLQPNPGGCS